MKQGLAGTYAGINSSVCGFLSNATILKFLVYIM